MSLSAGLIAPITEGATRSGGAAPAPPPPALVTPPTYYRRQPPPKQIPFKEHLIIHGYIRKPLSHECLLNGRIRRAFTESAFFSATAVKHINEAVSIGGFIITDDIPIYAWEALFEAVEDSEE